MNSIIEQMLSQHESAALSDKKNSIKEVVQEIMLCTLPSNACQSIAFECSSG